ncbi:hypothetical protein COO60DRAFT_768188 [Scenedesmus sp. NREL 46B-D3]|nr:hypothetical protein COO60DRAFT_768188 [Scenedesmus sp. NREL 46B-D3]
MGAQLPGLQNLTIDSEDVCSVVNCNMPGAFESAQRAELNISGMPNMMLIGPGGLLVFQNIILSDIAQSDAYVYSPAQPYRSQGPGTGTWPSIALAPNATLVLTNVTVFFRNPAPLDTCSQYTQRAVFSLQQLHPNASVNMFSDTGGRLLGPLSIRVDVRNGSTNVSVGSARINISNMTFYCLEKLPPASEAGAAGKECLAPGRSVGRRHHQTLCYANLARRWSGRGCCSCVTETEPANTLITCSASSHAWRYVAVRCCVACRRLGARGACSSHRSAGCSRPAVCCPGRLAVCQAQAQEAARGGGGKGAAGRQGRGGWAPPLHGAGQLQGPAAPLRR